MQGLEGELPSSKFFRHGATNLASWWLVGREGPYCIGYIIFRYSLLTSNLSVRILVPAPNASIPKVPRRLAKLRV